jgi:hypothetical protein
MSTTGKERIQEPFSQVEAIPNHPVIAPAVDPPPLEDPNLPTPVPEAPGLGIAPIEEPKTNPGPIPG